MKHDFDLKFAIGQLLLPQFMVSSNTEFSGANQHITASFKITFRFYMTGPGCSYFVEPWVAPTPWQQFPITQTSVLYVT
jgi:hypothetical protein